MKKKLTALIILDGFGYAPGKPGNAIEIEGAENIRSLAEHYPHTFIEASGTAVGLPEGQMGNSEVGHINLGAGRVVNQELMRITTDIKTGEFFENPAFKGAMENCRKHDSALHLYGLLSNGGVHSHTEHLFALVRMAKAEGIKKVFIHCFMDGRDTPPESGIEYIQKLQSKLDEYGCGRIATVGGRYYAMDRDKNYERNEKAYAAMVYGEGVKSDDPVKAVRASYDAGVTDEFIVPIVITDKSGEPVGLIKENDSIIFFNFRPDRARQISYAFTDPEFTGFERKNGFFPVHYVCFTLYESKLAKLAHIAFEPRVPKLTIGEYLSKLGKTQFRIAETEKYNHVTTFFNGGADVQFEGEDRILVHSPKVATFDLKPEMSAHEVTEKACAQIESGKYDFMVLNFANADMVGHTGILDAAVKAIAAVDECAKTVVDCILKNGGECLVTADHGNSECMIDSKGRPMTAHTTNPVPLIFVSDRADKFEFTGGGRLCDLAPTLLNIMGLDVPAEMTGNNLLKNKENK